jgi:hypothetical protein
MVFILCQRRRGPNAQLFQPFPQFIPVGLSSRTMLAVWAVESQEGQYVTIQCLKLTTPSPAHSEP